MRHEEVPHQAKGTKLSASAHPRNARIAIIGAGFCGIATAIALIRQGFEDITIFEAAPGIGGTWWHNRYPGAEVDLESHIYSYSFEPYDWSRTHVEWDELLEYLNFVARKWDVERRVRLNEAVESVVWDDRTSTYSLTTSSGEDHGAFDAVVSCIGFLNIPRMPEFALREHPFKGVVSHTSRWPGGISFDGKKVAVIGVGSSGVQIVTAAEEVAESVTIFQTTANWVIPKNARDFTDEERERYRDPEVYYAERQRLYDWYDEMQRDSSHARRDGHWNRVRRQEALDFMLKELEGRPDLIELVTPDFDYESRRTVNSDTYFRAIRSPKVEIVPFAATEFTETGLRDANGVERDFDIVVFATGFDAANYLGEIEVRGRDGLELHDYWNGEPSAMLGIMVPGFPNFFMGFGPNTNSIPAPIFFETEAGFVADALAELCEREAATVEIDEAEFEKYNEWVQERLGRTVWGDVRNYFQSGSGRIVSQWPENVSTYIQKVDEAKREALRFDGHRDR